MRSPTATPKLETLPTEQVYGVAKRISLDLEKYPLHTHAAIINMVNTLCQHRKIVFEEPQRQKEEEYAEIQRRAQMDAFQAATAAHAKRDAGIAEQIKASAETEDQPKAPRLSIVLDKHEPESDATGFVELPSAADLDAVEAEKQIALQTALAPEEELTAS